MVNFANIIFIISNFVYVYEHFCYWATRTANLNVTLSKNNLSKLP